MAYCTLEDLKKALPEAALEELTDDEGAGSIQDARVTEAIAQADALIDTYLGGRYAVPLSSVPAVVRQCSVDIALYYLYKRTVEGFAESITEPNTRRTAYKDALRILEDIRSGKMGLPVAGADDSGFAIGVVKTSHFTESTNLGGLEVCE
jgi:phage gp36-like protein